MSMDKSNRQQTVQMAIFVIILLTIAGILLSLTACTPRQPARKLPANEQAFISELDPLLHDVLDTNVEIDSMISLGQGVCASRKRGVDTEEIIKIIDAQYTSTQANAIFAAAVTNLCK